MNRRPRILVITGPTASGKTAAAILCARELDAEIVSADSRQLYRGLVIGTAAPTPEERSAVPHHFVGCIDAGDTYTAGAFFRDASRTIMDIHSRGRRVVVVGGSGLYVRAVVDGLFEGPAPNPDIRAALMRELRERGIDALHQELRRRDPAAAILAPASNVPRVLRALEICRATGQRASELRSSRMPDVPYDAMLAGLRWDRAELYARIDRRVDRMIAGGLLEEVRRLLADGIDRDSIALNAVGYREAIAHIRGELSHDDMVRLIKQHTRNFAKRQMTWFRKEHRLRWYDVDSEADIPAVCRSMVVDFSVE